MFTSKASMKIPNVCLVGRTNVGKSALFNRLTWRKYKALVFDQENVTRDYIEGTVDLEGNKFNLIDTGGIRTSKITCPLEKAVFEKVLTVISQADLVFLVCDIQVGLQEEDLRLARFVRKICKQEPVLILNKADNEQISLAKSDFIKLGISDLILTSAVHNKGPAKIVETIKARINFPEKPKEDLVEADTQQRKSEIKHRLKITIIGKPNVGKSSMLNALTSKERVVVSEVEGTTREAVVVSSKLQKEDIEIIDTPGVRRMSSVKDDLEQLMVKTALTAIRVSDLVLLVVDASLGKLCKQDLKLLSYAFEQKKSIILLLNKVDKLDDYIKQQLESDLKYYDFMIKKVPVIRTSCLNKKGVGKVRAFIEKQKERLKFVFDTDQVTEIVQAKLAKVPLYRQEQKLKIFKVRCMNDLRVPTFHLYVNEPRFFETSQLNFVENILRKNYDLLGCPVKFELRKV